MSISMNPDLCDRDGVRTGRQTWPAWLGALAFAVAGFFASAQPANLTGGTNQAAGTNAPASVESAKPPVEAGPLPVDTSPSRSAARTQQLDEAAFALIAERNIFNASRSGGRVQLSTRRPTRVETFTLVGTMAYDKGVFAFFEGSSSEFTKALKADGIIAGHKLADIYAGSVKLEADGKQIDLPIGSQMRREDAGAWRMAEVTVSSAASEAASPAARGGGSPASSPATSASADQSEILKRLMERREKE